MSRIKLKNLAVKVRVIPAKAQLLDKLAECCRGKRNGEILRLPSKERERVYHFPDNTLKEKFITALPIDIVSGYELL